MDEGLLQMTNSLFKHQFWHTALKPGFTIRCITNNTDLFRSAKSRPIYSILSSPQQKRASITIMDSIGTRWKSARKTIDGPTT